MNDLRNTWTSTEIKLFKKLNSPQKIQNYLNSLQFNFEAEKETCMSPRSVVEKGVAHCIEGAMLAASILKYHKKKPLLMHLRASKDDDDHVITLFRSNSKWGAISKTNHAFLRYRDPVYKNPRELAMSFFNEYFGLKTGRKNLRSFSTKPFDLSKYNKLNWETDNDNLWYINDNLFDSPHTEIASRSEIKKFRNADKVEMEAVNIVEWNNK